MLDIKFLRENPEVVKQNIKNKFQDHKLPMVDEVIAFDKEFSQLNGQLCPEYRDFRFRQKIRQGPNGIRVTMGQENTRNAVLVFK